MHAPHRNIEIKFRYVDLTAARRVVLAMGAAFHARLTQVDTWFRARAGRLKLRQIDGARSELIWYDRPDSPTLRESAYHLSPVADSQAMIAILSAACGVRGEVRKVREVYLDGNVRIHLDEVEGLGSFIEFEAVMDAESEDAPSLQRLDALRSALKIEACEACAASYADLLGI